MRSTAERGPGLAMPLVIALAMLLVGLWAGLVRIGWRLPALDLPIGQHGPLMISAFFGTLISLERAAALRRRPAYLAPLLSALGGVALVALPFAGAAGDLVVFAARALTVLGSLGLVLIFVHIVRLQLDAAHLTMGAGALLWLGGNLLWLGGLPVYQVVTWWIGFLVLTVAGERLELARVVFAAAGGARRGVRLAFAGAVTLFVLGLGVALVAFDAGVRIAGAGLLALGLWLLRYDLARRTIRSAGLTRFIAACLLPGYAWLALGGALWLALGGAAHAGPLYDARLHSVLLGFIFSMIFGHAPVILAGLLQAAIVYRPAFYAHLALLHASLLVRLAGDLWPVPGMRPWGGLLNVVAVLLFLAVTLWTVRSRPGPARAES